MRYLFLLLFTSISMASHIHPTSGAGACFASGVVHDVGDFGASTPAVVLPAPTVTAINPTSGSTAGSTAVSITGTNFVAGATSAIGGVTCTSPNVSNSTTLTCTTGANSAGVKSVVVTNPDTQSGTGSNLYTYTAPFAPSDVSGLKVWLKDTIVGSDGDAITSWTDESGNGYHFTNSTADQKPTLKTNIQNGRQITRCDGAGDGLISNTNSSNLISATAFSMWFVVNSRLVTNGTTTAGSQYGTNEGIWSEKASATLLGQFKDAGTPKFGLEHWGGSGANIAKTVTEGDWYVVHIRHESGNVYISVNNGAETSAADTGNTNPLNNVSYLCCNYNGPGNAGSCGQYDIGEVLIYNVAVGSSDRTSIQTYLNSRWAVY